MRLLPLTLLALGSALVLPSTHAKADSPAFPQADLMRIGVYYYPEAWPQSQWERDISNIKKLNLEFVHMGEFAWTFMEPKEGQYDFTWLDQAVKLCADKGLKVVLCTPSPTPPVWLAKAHPEILMVDASGRQMQHGSRQQATWTSDTYRAYVGKIVEQLGKHYGNNPAVSSANQRWESRSAWGFTCATSSSLLGMRIWSKSPYIWDQKEFPHAAFRASIEEYLAFSQSRNFACADSL